MDLSLAVQIADHLHRLLEPSCKRIEIAGSIRRKKPEVKDIELVASPRHIIPQASFGAAFGDAPMRSLLDASLYSLTLDECDGIRLRLLKGGERYKKYEVSIDGGNTYIINLDLFICEPPSDWGCLFLIRTGPAEFSHWMVTSRFLGGALPNGYKLEGNQIRDTRNGDVIPCPEEIDYFRFCGMGYIAPENRYPRWNRVTRKIQLSNPV